MKTHRGRPAAGGTRRAPRVAALRPERPVYIMSIYIYIYIYVVIYIYIYMYAYIYIYIYMHISHVSHT